MSERKVLSKYYPPDFDPSAIVRTRGPKQEGPKVQTVRLMAPFSMRCTACGEYIYKGRKFNARKEVTDEKYYSISVIRFYIRCTRCSAEITFKTDPRNMDYAAEKGAKRNFEPWRQAADDAARKETDEERLDRLEAEEAAEAAGEGSNAMEELESKMVDAKREMQIADALDEIRTRNARNEQTARETGGGAELVAASKLAADQARAERERQEKEDEEAARRAFTDEDGNRLRKLQAPDEGNLIEDEEKRDGKVDEKAREEDTSERPAAEASDKKEDMPPPVSFVRGVKRKKDFKAALGIKKRVSLV